MEAAMHDYRIYLIGANGKIQRGDDARCPDDEAALTTAMDMLKDYGLAEMWSGTKRLYIVATDAARLRPWPMPQMFRGGCSVVAFG
jgi:hypothetical protein